MAPFDVAVIGGGPAGATAARILAGGGARVCLLDKARFPRPKACGGALSPRTLRFLPAGVDRLIRTRISRAVFTFLSRRPFEIVSTSPMAYMICRDEFDAWLVAEAEAVGVVVRQGEAALHIEGVASKFVIRTTSGRVTTPAVIGADGVNGITAKLLFPERPPARYAALEAEPESRILDDSVEVDVGLYPGGYAWAFPKRDRLNVGVMVHRSAAARARGLLGGFLSQRGTVLSVDRVRGAFVAAPDATPVPCAVPGVLLVGDAAHLADPFLGEGIYSAVRSGALAAQAILAEASPAGAATRYADAVKDALWPDLVAAARIAMLFHRMPRWWHHLLSRMPNSLRQVATVLGGEDTYAELLRRTIAEIEDRAGTWIRQRLELGSPAWQAAPGEKRQT
jgi:geranylgeranyl reductase family protein